MAIVLDLMGDRGRASVVLSELVRSFPSNCRANKTLARLAIDQKEFQLALDDLDRAGCKGDGEYHLLRGLSLIALGRYSEGERELYACLQTHPRNLVAMNNLAIAFALSGRGQLALKLYQQVLQIDPNNQIASVNRKKLEEAPQP